jgi:hypothetical protein
MTVVKVAVKTCSRCDKETKIFATIVYPMRDPANIDIVGEYVAYLCPECFAVYEKLDKNPEGATSEDYVKEFLR